MADLEFEQRQAGAGEDPFINVPVRRPVKEPASRWKRMLRATLHATGAVVLLAAGTIWTLGQQHPKFVKPGQLLNLPAAVVTAQPPGTEPYTLPTDAKAREEVLRVRHALLRYTRDTARAQRIATAVVAEGGRRNLSPALLIGVLLTEDVTLNPRAKSFVGARGLMQVMPFHAGKWKQCPSSDLFSIENNICYGTSILADMVKRSPNLNRALLRYNGCVRGTNTPNCKSYSGKVLKFAEQAATRMLDFSMTD